MVSPVTSSCDDREFDTTESAQLISVSTRALDLTSPVTYDMSQSFLLHAARVRQRTPDTLGSAPIHEAHRSGGETTKSTTFGVGFR